MINNKEGKASAKTISAEYTNANIFKKHTHTCAKVLAIHCLEEKCF